jgi:hypothetical protein
MPIITYFSIFSASESEKYLMAQPALGNELELFKQYLRSESKENARSPYLYPLFQKLFKDKFKIESDACGADVYIDGALIVESKTESSQWLDGFYQALHYQRRFGLAYNTIMVVANRFVGIWKVNKLPEEAVIFSHTIEAYKAPSEVGKLNAKRTQKPLRNAIASAAFYFLTPKDLEGDIFAGAKNLTTETYEILKILRNLDSDRLQINTHNFINTIERFKPFFQQPIEAVHAFYAIIAYWDITATVAVNDGGTDVRVIGFKGQKFSDPIHISPRAIPDFKKLIETNYIFTNEGSGLTVDYYFSRFDEVLAKIDPAYVKQHGIFFTNDNLSKFALWYVKQQFGEKLESDYIVFDPAGGSGNLVSSWKGKLKHKIISELQPDLLRIIDRRMRADPWHIDHGFTIVPKTSEGKGLNFLDQSAESYLQALSNELAGKQIRLDKPLAFLLNPPYKNTDENVKERQASDAEYTLNPDILELTGEDAGKERYLAFLGQILLMSRLQYEKPGVKPLVMIFTPTSWLIPRPTYVAFRKKWDAEFAFRCGFIVTSNEWFKLDGKWPLAFSIWEYEPDIERTENKVILSDLTQLTKTALNVEWNAELAQLNFAIHGILDNALLVKMDNSRGDIRNALPTISRNGKLLIQSRLNLYRNKSESEKEQLIFSGFPLKDQRHSTLKEPYGYSLGEFVGFMDNCTPIRIKQDPLNRQSNQPDRIWFRLDTDFKGTNRTKIFNGPADNRSYCAYDLESAKVLNCWFAITKAFNGVYPVWANQFDIWMPNLPKEKESAFYALCFAFVLAENRCVVTKFEANNPVQGAPEVFVQNPLSTNTEDAFWHTTLLPYVEESREPDALALVKSVTEFYRYWNHNYTKGQFIESVGLHNEPYFRYFDYPDFLTPNSGLIQIRKYAEIHQEMDLLSRLEDIQAATKVVKKAIYEILVRDCKYFE